MEYDITLTIGDAAPVNTTLGEFFRINDHDDEIMDQRRGICKALGRGERYKGASGWSWFEIAQAH